MNSEEKIQLIGDELLRVLDDKGSPTFTKSKFISKRVDLTSKEVGSLIGEVPYMFNNVGIEKYGYSGSTSWKIILVCDFCTNESTSELPDGKLVCDMCEEQVKELGCFG